MRTTLMQLSLRLVTALAACAPALAIAPASTVQAADEDVTVAVLGIEASSGAPEAVASALTDALRQQVTSIQGFRLLPGRDLVEVKLVFSCPDEAPSCMAQAGKSLGVTKLIFGVVTASAGDTYVVTLKLVDTNRGVVDSWVAEQVTKMQATAAGLKGPVQKWFGTLTGQRAVGTIHIKGEMIGTSVSLDGTPQGVTGADDLVISNVSVGQHELLATKPGYDPVRRPVSVAAGDTIRVALKLQKSAAIAAAPAPHAPAVATALAPKAQEVKTIDATAVAAPDRGGRTGVRAASWAVLGAGLAGIVLGVKFALDVNDINQQLDPFRRYPCKTSPIGLCDIKGQPANRPLTMAEEQSVKNLQDDGTRYQTYQIVAFSTGGALLIAGGYLFYRGYLAQEAAAPVASAGRRRLELLPAFGHRHAGLYAAFGF